MLQAQIYINNDPSIVGGFNFQQFLGVCKSPDHPAGAIDFFNNNLYICVQHIDGRVSHRHIDN